MHTGHDRDRLLATLLETTLDVTRALDLDSVVYAIIDRSMEITGAPYGAAVTLTPEGEIATFHYRGLTEEQVAMLPHIPEGKGLLGLVIESRETHRLDRMQDHPSSVGFPEKHVGMAAFLGVPLQHREALVGALYLTKSPGMEPFSESDETFFQTMGAIATVGITNARMYAAEHDRAERGALMTEIASKVRHSLDVEEVLNATVTALGRAAQVDRCFIRLVDEESPSGELAGTRYEWVSSGTRSLQGETNVHFPISTIAAAERTTTWSDDIMEDERLLRPDSPASPKQLVEQQIRAALATPLAWGDELLGVVAFNTKTPRKWSEADIALIEAAAREVSIALNHATRFTKAIQTADKLRQVDELRSDFVAMVSHELRSPMTVVAGIADILKKRQAALTPEQRGELIDTLGREARRLTRLVSEVLDLEAIEQGGMELQLGEVDLATLAREAVTDAGAAERIDLSVGRGDAMVVADSDRVKQVLLNLISNAVKFTPDQSTISVSVSPQQGSVLVAVVDKGPGISEENQPRLFQRFSRLEGPGGVRMPGSGLGLYLSRSIIEAHGGDIWVDSEPGKGSTFAFRLPRLAQQKLPGT